MIGRSPHREDEICNPHNAPGTGHPRGTREKCGELALRSIRWQRAGARGSACENCVGRRFTESVGQTQNFSTKTHQRRHQEAARLLCPETSTKICRMHLCKRVHSFWGQLSGVWGPYKNRSWHRAMLSLRKLQSSVFLPGTTRQITHQDAPNHLPSTCYPQYAHYDAGSRDVWRQENPNHGSDAPHALYRRQRSGRFLLVLVSTPALDDLT